MPEYVQFVFPRIRGPLGRNGAVLHLVAVWPSSDPASTECGRRIVRGTDRAWDTVPADAPPFCKNCVTVYTAYWKKAGAEEWAEARKRLERP